MFLSQILIDSCIIIHYIVEEKIFVVIVYMHSLEKKLNRHIKDCFKINGQQTIKMPQKGEYVKFKNCQK